MRKFWKEIEKFLKMDKIEISILEFTNIVKIVVVIRDIKVTNGAWAGMQ